MSLRSGVERRVFMALKSGVCRPVRPRRASFGSKEAMRGGDSVTHQLTKKLQHLKKKIKQFEEQFEKERNYKVRPNHLRSGLLSFFFPLFISRKGWGRGGSERTAAFSASNVCVNVTSDMSLFFYPKKKKGFKMNLNCTIWSSGVPLQSAGVPGQDN